MNIIRWIKKILRIYGLRFLDAVLRIYNYFIPRKTLSVSVERWNSAQSEELEHHLDNKWRNSPRFTIDTKALFDSFGFNENQYQNKSILDIGGGSKLRGKYFNDGRLFVIEPLANKFLKEISWCDLHEAEKVFSIGAEIPIKELDSKVDFAFSINVLDHCRDFPKIIENLYNYLKPDGTAFLTFDEHLTTENMHPLVLTPVICDEIFREAGFQIAKFSTGLPKVYQRHIGRKTNTYGHGPRCLNYWLMKKT